MVMVEILIKLFHQSAIGLTKGSFVIPKLNFLCMTVFNFAINECRSQPNNNQPASWGTLLPILRTHTISRTIPRIIPPCARRVAICFYANGEMGLGMVLLWMISTANNTLISAVSARLVVFWHWHLAWS